MKSAVAASYEIDDVNSAADQLYADISSKLELQIHSAGILYCDADVDGARLTGILSERFGFDIAGMTTLAAIDKDGYRVSAIVLTIMTDGKSEFVAAPTEPLGNLTDTDVDKRIVQAFRNTTPQGSVSGEPPRIVFIFAPSGMTYAADRYPNALKDPLNGAPLLGGIASDDYDFQRARVFLSGKEYKDAAVFMSVWSGIHPIFALNHVTSRFAVRTRQIEKSKGNTVYRVGGETFVDYLKGFDLRTDVENVLLAFNSYPMILTRPGADETPVMRHICALDEETGTGTFLGEVPEGAMANICLVNIQDLKEATRKSMEELKLKASESHEGEYSTVFCISCCGRAMILGMESDAESKILSDELPDNLSLTGAYCLGEFSPTSVKNNQAINRFHNCSIALCMI
jgi:hypothetical protein